MNILFYRYNSICEIDILDAFENLGHTVTCITEEMYNKSLSPNDTLKLVHNALYNGNYDFVFSINFFPVISEVCNIYHIRYLSWVVDSPVLELFSYSLSNPYNRTFLFDSALYQDFIQYNPNRIFYLPLACNVNSKQHVIRNASAKQVAQFTHKVSFVGSLYSEKNPYIHLKHSSDYMRGYLDSIIEAQAKVFGYYFIDELITDEIVTYFHQNLERHYEFPDNSHADYKALISQFFIGSQLTVLDRTRMMQRLSAITPIDIYTFSDTSALPCVRNHGGANTANEMPLIFHNSQINLNPTARSIRNGVSLRIWDILGCEGFLLCNHQNDLLMHLEPGTHFEIYTSEEELSDKVCYYLEHPSQCRDIAHTGYEYVRDNHSYILRIQEMLQLAFSI